jgi:transcriptional regulator GlxA family with amidase domain
MKIGFLVFPDFNILDLSGPLAVFDVPRREMSPSPYSLTVHSAHGGLVASACGVAVDTTALTDEPLDTFVVVGGLGAIAASHSASLIELVKRASRHARRVASVCSGVFLLAEAGLIGSRRVTTHWEYGDKFRRAYPDAKLQLDQIYLRDGNVWTSGGVTAGIDLALALVEEDVGVRMAQRTARVLCVYHRRVGAQSQLSALLEMEPATDRLRKAMQFARDHLAEELPVERLAVAAHVSPRQFTRLLFRETGETPAKAVERLRAEVAHTQVANTTLPIESIARTVGFSNAERMRRAFLRIYGAPPQEVRRVTMAPAEAQSN